MTTKRTLLILCMLAVGAVRPSVAHARAQRDVDYRFEQVWNAVVRLLRVDYRFPIEERDDAHGFVLFSFREYGRTHAASIEAVRAPVEEGAPERVRLVVNIEGMPTHAEAALLDHLERKLRAEFGAPQRRPAVAQRGVDPRMPRLSERTTDDAAAAEAPRQSASESARVEESRPERAPGASAPDASAAERAPTDETAPVPSTSRRASRRR